MKKHRLQVETLSVESFPVAPAAEVLRGTVHAAEATALCSQGPVTCHPTYDPCDTCATSCAGGPLCDCLPSGCPKASVCCPTA